jgi:MtaA/CmuA family methyltransferase
MIPRETPREIFLGAIRRQAGPRRATGTVTSIVTADLMDRVGAHFPEAHGDAELMAKLAAAGHTILGFDNVMPLFSVWHESAALGSNVDWGSGDRMPDCSTPLAALDGEIRVPDDLLSRPGCAVPLRALDLLRRRLGDEVAVVGKVFGPWTLGYHLFGVEEFLINTLLQPDVVKRAMDHLKEVTVRFGLAQLEAGADALCLADHATRDLCSPEAYRVFLRDTHAELVERLPCPLVLHICGDTSDRICHINETGVPCFHFDSKVPAATARSLAADHLALMGGTSNIDVIRNGTEDDVRRDVAAKLRCGIDILGPECAVPLDAPYANMVALSAAVKQPKESMG